MKLLNSPDLIGNELYLASMAGGGVLRSEDMRRPPDSRVDLVPELIPTFVRPSYRSIGMLGGCRSVPPIMPEEDLTQRKASANWPFGELSMKS